MYLDGTLVGTKDGPVHYENPTPLYTNSYIGSVFLGGNWPDESHYSTTSNTGYATFFNGSVSDVAFYNSALSAAQVGQQWSAAQASSGLTPVVTVQTIDPGGRTITDVYDPLMGNRPLSHTDALGAKTVYGYDAVGFLSTVTDPNGNVTNSGRDVRGNVVSQTSCKSQYQNQCATTYFAYYPDDTSTTLTPDPRNDMLVEVRDARSASATDNTYLTRYTYNAAGNRTAVTTAPVPGYPSGRTMTIAYTDGSTTAVDGGTPPVELPNVSVSPGGATQRVSYFRTVTWPR
jgi:YD repeat-containing protein